MFKRLEIGTNAVLPGFVVKTSNPRMLSQIGSLVTRSGSVREVNRIRNPGASNNMNNALLEVKDTLFKKENGARPDVPKSVLLFINGQSKPLLLDTLKQLKDLNVRITVVTQGKEIDKDKTKDVMPNVDAWFFPEDLEDMKRKIKPITNSLFSGTR